MNTNKTKILTFLGAKFIPQKASPSKNSTTTLDYSNIIFNDDIFPSMSQFQFDRLKIENNWNYLMTIRRCINNKGIKVNMNEHYIHIEYIHNGNYLLSKNFSIFTLSEQEALFQALLTSIDFYNNHRNLFE